jgi:NAD+ kinase
MKKVLLIPNPKKDTDFLITNSIAKKLSSIGFELFSQKDAHIDGAKALESNTNIDLIVVIGGDGSVLDASMLAVELDIPLIGVNLGKMGYLTEIDKEALNVLDALLEDKYEIKEKMLLSVEIPGKDSLPHRFAVNDCIISHDSYLGVADFSLSIDSGEVVKYRADGIVVSTPVGSTAYSLSSGGPIVSHDVDALIVTPICPHSFFNRSLVLPTGNTLTISNTGRDKLNVSLDGRYFLPLLPNENCIVKVASKKLKMLTFKKDNMISALFTKMKLMEIAE